jgi:hypothetical protein
MASAGAGRTSKSPFTVAPPDQRIPAHLMPGEAQLIQVAEGDKEAFVPVIALRFGRELGKRRFYQRTTPAWFFF